MVVIYFRNLGSIKKCKDDSNQQILRGKEKKLGDGC